MRKIALLTILALFVVFPKYAAAGAWGTGSFENDDALDWIQDLEVSSGNDLLRNSLTIVLTAKYIQAPDGSIAIAAAETVAALFGKPSAELPDEIKAWVRLQQRPDPKLKDLAMEAMLMIKNSDASELKALWFDAKDLSEEWNREMDELISRLK